MNFPQKSNTSSIIMMPTTNYKQTTDALINHETVEPDTEKHNQRSDQCETNMNLSTRLDPRTILLVFPTALTCVFLLSHECLRDIYFILYIFAVLLYLGRITHVAVWAIIISIAHIPLFALDNPSYQFFFLPLIIRKICMILSTGQILLASISVGDSINLMKRMKLHRAFIIPTAICFRFIPTLVFEAGIIRDALKIRRLYSPKAIILHPLTTFEIFISTFLFRTFALGEELFFSLSTRGLNFKGDNFYRDVAFSYRDALFILFTALYLVFVLFSPLPELTI